MTSMTNPQLVTAAETARLLGVTRQRVLELAGSTDDFPAAEPTSTGGRVWPRGAVQTWAATHPDPGPVFTVSRGGPQGAGVLRDPSGAVSPSVHRRHGRPLGDH